MGTEVLEVGEGAERGDDDEQAVEGCGGELEGGEEGGRFSGST